MPKVTIEELAQKLSIPLPEVLKSAEQALARNGINRHHRVTTSQSAQIQKFIAINAVQHEVLLPAPTVVSTPSTKSDKRSEISTLRFPDLGFKVLCHQDVYEGLQDHSHLNKRATLAVRQIVTSGHTSVVKGCSDPDNRGWLRSPLGGGNKNHFYLWWARQGSPALQGLNLGQNDIVIRDVRHHDDHSRLGAGRLEDYVYVEREELGDTKGEFESPWNQAQLAFINSETPVRLAVGRPGSGKTTVLWQSVDVRTNQDVLYVTWSPKLVHEAEKHFNVFSSNGTRIRTFDFLGLLGQLCGKDIPRKTLQHSREEFNKFLPIDNSGRLYGPWINRTNELFAEIRAHLVGALALADIEPVDGEITGDILCNSYSKDDRAIKRLGKVPVDALVKIVMEIEKSRPIASFFPELDYSARATTRLRANILPPGFDAITRIVVDEIQDLTLLELNTFMELSKAISRTQGTVPFMLLAGDEGQTVRPSGFQWGPVGDLISNQLQMNPENFLLESSVRYPGRISEILENASKLYGLVGKASRPRKQSRVSPEDYRQAQVLHVSLSNDDAGIELLRKLVDLDGILVVTAGDHVPDWIKNEVGEGVLTPLESKGLEYQSVCVINPGKELVEIEKPASSNFSQLEILRRRTRIDQLRVAMSRATENLVFVDIHANAQELSCSRNLLDNPSPFEASDLIDFLSRPDTTPEERVLQRIGEANALIETRPARAWQLVVQALDMLGEPGLHNGVTDPSLRAKTIEATLSIACNLLVDGLPAGITSESMIGVANVALGMLGSAEFSRAFNCFSSWAQGNDPDPFDMLDAMSEIEPPENWLRNALSGKAQTLIGQVESGAANALSAARFETITRRWLEVCSFTGDIQVKSTSLKRQAVDTLLAVRRANDAESVFFSIDDIFNETELEDQVRIGKIRNIQERWVEAAQAFELGGVLNEAVNNWRSAGMWEEAQRVAQLGGIDDQDLDWLLKVDSVVNAMPKGLPNRLQEKERSRVADMRNRIQIVSLKSKK